jgi:hypothetical protein
MPHIYGRIMSKNVSTKNDKMMRHLRPVPLVS